MQEIIKVRRGHHMDEITNTMSLPVEDIVIRNQDKLLRLAVAIMGNATEAEDVVQDVFVKLIQKQPAFDTLEHETAWLITVTKNVAKSRLRSFWRKNSTELLDVYPAQNAEQHELMDTVMSLPVKYRVVIHLFYYEGYSTKEIASMTKQKEGTVREQLTRARRLLKKYLTEEEMEESDNERL